MHHHAYIYEGPLSLLPKLADSAASRFGFVRENNPDVYVREWEKFGIDESRQLADLAAFKSAGDESFFILGISSITTEAQQALLKLFEEPRQGAVFVVLVPHGEMLATLRSRFLEYPEKLESKQKTTDAEDFLATAYAKRSAWVTSFLKDEENTREKARAFLGELESYLHKQMSRASYPLNKEIREGLEDIAHFRDYLSDKAPSLKMILEHFAATLPILK